jgi:hypothetical protein
MHGLPKLLSQTVLQQQSTELRCFGKRLQAADTVKVDIPQLHMLHAGHEQLCCMPAACVAAAAAAADASSRAAAPPDLSWQLQLEALQLKCCSLLSFSNGSCSKSFGRVV